MSNMGTAFEFATGRRRGAEPVLIFPVASSPKPPMELLTHVDAACQGAVSELIGVGAVPEKPGQIAHTTRSGRCRRVLVVSLGKHDQITVQTVRDAARAAARWLIDQKVQRAALWVDGLIRSPLERPVSEFAGAMVVGGFQFDEHKHPDPPPPETVRIALRSGDAAYLTGATGRVNQFVALGKAVNYARRLGHEPANVLHPEALAAEARRLAREYGFRSTVMNAATISKHGMNGILSVGRGAERKPCLIRMDYRGAPGSRPRIVVIGKAVTFDTGGYSLKDKQGLENLKFDKCGGAAVFGIMRAAAEMKLRCNLTALVPAAENAISEEAYRPGDIIRMMSGKTVEIISTDAEGRLILADALWYAQKHCKPTVMIDLATLTGGVIIALGKVAAGLMSNDEDLAAELEECGRNTHERLWRLPLWDEYADLIKGNDSDIKNSSGKREAHPVVGGMFLKQFVNDTPWAHIDIAGVATDNSGVAATGFGVRLVVEYLRRRAARAG